MNRFSRLRIGLAVLFIIFSLVTPSWAQNTPPVADAGGPYAGTAGSAITFDGSGSYDSDKGDQIVLYEWDLDYDGKYEVQGKTVNKTFASATSGRVQLRVWDSHQASDTDTASYVVNAANQDPVADAGGPYQAEVGEPVTLDGSGSYDPDGQVQAWHWDLDNDGQYDDAYGKQVQHTWYSPYTGSVGLRVYDAQQAFDTDTASVTITPKNQTPVADAGGPYSAYVGESLRLDGSASHDPDGQIASWKWDLDNDGNYDDASGEVVWQTWSVPFSGEIGLRVTDAQGANDTDKAQITISSRPTGELRGTVFFDRNRSGTPEQGEQGLVGWLVYLDRNRNGQPDPAEPVTHSQTDGLFQFPELEPGTYRVAVVRPDEDWEIVAPAQGYHDLTVPAHQIVRFDFAVFKSLRYDYGDAPEPGFPTLQASGGARHRVTADSLCLGRTVDTEADGLPHVSAMGDDFDTMDDEDGVVFRTIFRPGAEGRLDLTVNNRKTTDEYAVVACWLDVDGNGRWDLPDELLEYWLLTALPGENTWDLGLAIPADARTGATTARFRVYRRERPEDSVVLTPDGDGGVGEVEDHQLILMDPDLTYDFGDAPDGPYPTLLPQGAWHSIVPGLSLGDSVDSEENGAPDALALGDGEDEDGVTFAEALVPGASVPVRVEVLNNSAEERGVFVSGWIDFDGSGTWDMDEHVAGLERRLLAPWEGAVSLNPIEIPLSAKPGRSYARYRLYHWDPNDAVFTFLSPVGFGGRGEVEDYAVELGEPIVTYTTDEPTPPEGEWEIGEPNGSGGTLAGYPDPTSAHTGAQVFGVNLDGDYSPTVGGPYYLELGPFRCMDYARVTVRYYRWLNSGPEVRNTVEVRNSDTGWSTLWTSPVGSAITDSAWQYCEFDITEWAACHPRVYLRWGYEVLAEGTPYSGWNIDDLRLLGAPNELVPFTDVNLKAAVINRLVDMGVSDFSTPPTACQMLALTSLNVSESDIHSLGGLEYAHNLTYLNAENNQIADLEPLRQLNALTELHLAHNRIRDLRPLADLTQLWNLSLSYNEIENIGPLGALVELTHLYLAYNQIPGVDVLDWSGLSSGMTVLDLAGNRIADIDALGSLPRLWSLIVNNNEVHDIGVLAEFPDISRLTLSGNQIEDIEPLRDLRHLTYLNLRNNDLDTDSCALLDELRLTNPGIEIVEPASCAP